MLSPWCYITTGALLVVLTFGGHHGAGSTAHPDPPSSETNRKAPRRRAATGPLRVLESNPRYFTDGTGKAIYLTGFQYWDLLREDGSPDPKGFTDFGAFLDKLERYGVNFLRYWRWNELAKFRYTQDGEAFHSSPSPWLRTGPGRALDGHAKFDLTRFDPSYFKRLRSRVEAAGKRGIYVSIMLFEGHSIQASDAPWRWQGHPFHKDNNINGIDGDPNGDGLGVEVHALEVPAITAVQEAYVQKVIDTVNDLDNVLYEVCNEAGGYSTQWQYHIIRFIKNYQRNKPKQHPVGMSCQLYPDDRNQPLFDSPADWIAPAKEGGYVDDPPAADGRKVVLSDTDHLMPGRGNRAWVWKSFLRGLNPVLYMEPGQLLDTKSDLEDARRAMGQTLRYATRMNLATMTPRNDLASTKYCLAAPGSEYLVYLPTERGVTVDLSAVSGEVRVEWFDSREGIARSAGRVPGGGKREFRSPFDGDAVLHLVRSKGR